MGGGGRDQVINGKNRKTKNYGREISINKMSNEWDRYV
jgi:hypothetical protein